MPYTTTTLADLQTLMIQRWDQVVFWTPEEARLALNEALREWNLLTGRWRTRVGLSALAATPDLQLPGVLTYAMRVTTAAGSPLIPTSILELDLGRPSWRLDTTATGSTVPTVPTLWAPLSLTQISIWPCYPVDTPAALLVDGVMRTPVLVAPDDFVDLGEEVVDVITDMALHVAALKEAGDRWRQTRVYFEAFLVAAAEENSLLKQNQAYRRWAGLDRRRDLQPSTGAPNQLQGLATQFSRHDAAEQE
ncbi:MAG TPA: hypothetical protein VFU85_00895 [Nocardioides sp.]|nr:hypothetical protein [Nocardioides sp.]